MCILAPKGKKAVQRSRVQKFKQSAAGKHLGSDSALSSLLISFPLFAFQLSLFLGIWQQQSEILSQHLSRDQPKQSWTLQLNFRFLGEICSVQIRHSLLVHYGQGDLAMGHYPMEEETTNWADQIPKRHMLLTQIIAFSFAFIDP